MRHSATPNVALTNTGLKDVKSICSSGKLRVLANELSRASYRLAGSLNVSFLDSLRILKIHRRGMDHVPTK